MRLQYEAKELGPYAKNLRQVLIRLESHYKGYSDGNDSLTQAIELLPGAVEEARTFLQEDEPIRQRMERVTDLIESYEDPVGLELLSSVHWVMCHNPEAKLSAAAKAVHEWNARKHRTLKTEHLTRAWKHLADKNWVPVETMA